MWKWKRELDPWREVPSNEVHCKNIKQVIQWKNWITYLQLQKRKGGRIELQQSPMKLLGNKALYFWFFKIIHMKIERLPSHPIYCYTKTHQILFKEFSPYTKSKRCQIKTNPISRRLAKNTGMEWKMEQVKVYPRPFFSWNSI